MPDKLHTEIRNHRLAIKLRRIRHEMDFTRKNISKFLLLTDREKEVMTMVCQGHNNPKVAEELCISRYTVEQHRKNIHRKLGINGLSEMMSYGYAFDLVGYPKVR